MGCGMGRDELLDILEKIISEFEDEEERDAIERFIGHLVDEHGFSRLEAILLHIANGAAILYESSSFEKGESFYAKRFGKTKNFSH